MVKKTIPATIAGCRELLTAGKLAAEWQAFARITKRMIQDALRPHALADFTTKHYALRVQRQYERLLDLALAPYTDADARHQANRLEKYPDRLYKNILTLALSQRERGFLRGLLSGGEGILRDSLPEGEGIGGEVFH